MSDIVARAEGFLLLDQRINRFVGCYSIIRELVAELKRLRGINASLSVAHEQARSIGTPFPAPFHTNLGGGGL